MRLSESQVKQAILHPDQNVRDAAIYYFSRSFSTDPDLVTLALQVVRQYGVEHAFFAYSFLNTLVHSDDSIRWLIQQIEMHEEPDDEDEDHFFDNLLSALSSADPSLLAAHEPEIAGMDNLDEYTAEAIYEQIHLPTLRPDTLWRELESFCQDFKEGDGLHDEDVDFACRLVSALAVHGNRFADQVLAILREENDYTLMTELAARLAGEMRLEAAVPFLTEMLNEGDDELSEECHWALIKIGTVSVVEHLCAAYRPCDSDQRLSVPSILENIHSDASVQACLKLLAVEESVLLRGHLIQAILHNCSTEGIEPARHHILNTPVDPDVLEVRFDLLTACKMMGVTFPEFDAWAEDSKNDTAFRKQWNEDHRADYDLDEELDDDATIIEEENGHQLPPVVRRNERTGRNDPCPCGSGKKFKNCCYGKTGMLEEPDATDASSVFDQGRRVFHEQYPMGTVAHYGPDDTVTTKIVAAVIRSEGAEPILERWVGTNVMSNPKVRRQIQEFFERNFVKAVMATDANIGCPHEEGPDFPVGHDCPFCPFWAGKQGSGAE